MQIKVIFIRMVLHLDSLGNRGTRELGNGLFIIIGEYLKTNMLNYQKKVKKKNST